MVAQKIYKLRKDCTSEGAFTIKHIDETFKVQQAGIEFTLLATATQKKPLRAHFGLLCHDNIFVTPDGAKLKYVMIHRVAANIEVVFSDKEHDIENALRAVLGESASVVSRVKVGNITKPASKYY